MTEFDAVLKRAFAEAHEPADEGFSVRVGHAVARRERMGQVYSAIQMAGIGLAGAAIAYGGYILASTFGQEFLANAGLEVARAHGALTGATPVATSQAQDWMQSLGAGLTQVLLIVAALTGGAVAYRATQD
jgi:hypothetical protein